MVTCLSKICSAAITLQPVPIVFITWAFFSFFKAISTEELPMLGHLSRIFLLEKELSIFSTTVYENSSENEVVEFVRAG